MNIEQKITFLKQSLTKPVVLIGTGGAGKTSIGKSLAGKLKLNFIDSDDVIERQEKFSIPEIFERFGEEHFRQMERDIIIELAGSPKVYVIGTGGGAFMNEQTQAVVIKNTLSVFLKADLEVLSKRVGSGAGRPLFAGKEPADVLATLIEQRYPIYSEADITVETKDEPLKETLNRVIEALYSHYISR